MLFRSRCHTIMNHKNVNGSLRFQYCQIEGYRQLSLKIEYNRTFEKSSCSDKIGLEAIFLSIPTYFCLQYQTALNVRELPVFWVDNAFEGDMEIKIYQQFSCSYGANSLNTLLPYVSNNHCTYRHRKTGEMSSKLMSVINAIRSSLHCIGVQVYRCDVIQIY